MASDLKEIPTRPNQIEERAEAHLMLAMMHKDGYVSKQGDNPFYETLNNGLIFLDNGGYTRAPYYRKFSAA